MTVGREVGELAFAEAGLTDRGLAWARGEGKAPQVGWSVSGVVRQGREQQGEVGRVGLVRRLLSFTQPPLGHGGHQAGSFEQEKNPPERVF